MTTKRPHTQAQKSQSRRDRRRELESACALIDVPHHCDVCVVGGGAAGLACAIAAAEAGARTVILERELECGRSILATGGGRCNFSNRSLDASHYNEADFVASVCGDTWLEDVLSFFKDSGLAWTEEESRLYPASMQAASVQEVLRARATRAEVLFACGRSCTQIEAPVTTPKNIADTGQALDPVWTIHFNSPSSDDEILLASALVIATGGAPILHGLALPTRPYEAVLCPLAARGLPFHKLNGRRARVKASLWRDGTLIRSETGELLFRAYGLSGIVIFDLSRYARPNDTLILDLAPALSALELEQLCCAAGTAAGIIDPVIAHVLEAQVLENSRSSSHGQKQRTRRTGEIDMSHESLVHELVASIKELSCTILGPELSQPAQLMRGGLMCSAFDSTTLMSRAHPGLFVCGEALDVDGACGGYNLSWAWKSGLVAGQGAAAWSLSQAHSTRDAQSST